MPSLLTTIPCRRAASGPLLRNCGCAIYGLCAAEGELKPSNVSDGQPIEGRRDRYKYRTKQEDVAEPENAVGYLYESLIRNAVLMSCYAKNVEDDAARNEWRGEEGLDTPPEAVAFKWPARKSMRDQNRCKCAVSVKTVVRWEKREKVKFEALPPPTSIAPHKRAGHFATQSVRSAGTVPRQQQPWSCRQQHPTATQENMSLLAYASTAP